MINLHCSDQVESIVKSRKPIHTFHDEQAIEEGPSKTVPVENVDEVAQDEAKIHKTPETIIKDTPSSSISPPSIFKTPKKNDDFVFKTPIKTAGGTLTTPLKTTPSKPAPLLDDPVALSLTTPQKELLLSPTTPVTRFINDFN